jgi:nucleotide-binding universal stress UspA family protein
MDELKAIAERAEAVRVPVQVLVRSGEVDDEIRVLAVKQKVDLVVMGTHGRRGFERFLLGSKTERLLRTLHVPLLTIGGNARVTPAAVKNILVTTDFSDGTAEAVDYAMSIRRKREAKVTLLHVLDDVQADISGRYREQLVRSIRQELESLVPAGDSKSGSVSVRVEIGRPIPRLLLLLKKEKFDLIVMNIHGKTLLDRITIGSTAEKIVRAATVPVLVIPPQAAAARKRAGKQAA